MADPGVIQRLWARPQTTDSGDVHETLEGRGASPANVVPAASADLHFSTLFDRLELLRADYRINHADACRGRPHE
jgi:hypothetical protein